MFVFYNIGSYPVGVVYFEDAQYLKNFELSHTFKYEWSLHPFSHLVFKVTWKMMLMSLPPIHSTLHLPIKQ